MIPVDGNCQYTAIRSFRILASVTTLQSGPGKIVSAIKLNIGDPVAKSFKSTVGTAEMETSLVCYWSHGKCKTIMEISLDPLKEVVKPVLVPCESSFSFILPKRLHEYSEFGRLKIVKLTILDSNVSLSLYLYQTEEENQRENKSQFSERKNSSFVTSRNSLQIDTFL